MYLLKLGLFGSIKTRSSTKLESQGLSTNLMGLGLTGTARSRSKLSVIDMRLSQLCYGPVVTYCMVYHSTKRAMLARLLANESPAIYAVH